MYHTVHAGQTLGYDDGTYTNCFFKYDTDLVRFCRLCRAHADEIKAGPKMNERRTEELDMIHTSIIPWFSFINIKNPRKNKWDSIPKINFGKMSLSADGRSVMPLELSVHHALMDGYQMGLFFNR